eukprot:COSAG02_NODE_14419_length_1274_cov_2.691064_1_plen_45_part_10
MLEGLNLTGHPEILEELITVLKDGSDSLRSLNLSNCKMTLSTAKD